MTMRMLCFTILLATVPVAAASPQGSAAALPAAPGAGVPEYQLGPGDVIRVDVLDEPLLTKQGLRIDTDGTFDYPYLGRVEAKGKTKRELKNAIETGLINGGFVLKPIVTVDVEVQRPRTVQVVGEVRAVNKYPLTPGMTLLDALSAAGGLLPSAGTRVKVLRRLTNADGSPAAAPPITFEFNLNEVYDLKPEANPELREDDRISVGKAEKYYVSGQVKNTGEQIWEPGLTVRAALAKAGGIGEKGSARRIRIIRIVDGKEKKLDAEYTTLVQPGDTIDVGQRLL
jgi:polysaccharide biosynthesis/export protein